MQISAGGRIDRLANAWDFLRSEASPENCKYFGQFVQQKKTEELPQTSELGPKRSLPSRSLVSKLQTSDFSTQMHQIFTRALHAAL